MNYRELLECDLEGDATLFYRQETYGVKGFQMVLVKPVDAQATPQVYWMIPFERLDQQRLGHPGDASVELLYQLAPELQKAESDLLSAVSDFEPLLERRETFLNLASYQFMQSVNRGQKLSTVISTLNPLS